jgi:hypothetical protein
MKWLKSPFFWFLLAVLTTAGLTAIGPEEKVLGDNVRIVYLHGAWVLTAEAALALAGLTGLLGIILRHERLHRWSSALGRTGIFFWVTYLPLSLWAMQANWNGLFLSEPRFRIAFIFAVTGVLLQVGLVLLARPVLTSLANFLFFAALEITLRQADYVMHPPPSPIFSSGILSLQLFFIGVIFLTLAAAYFLTRWWLQKQP